VSQLKSLPLQQQQHQEAVSKSTAAIKNQVPATSFALFFCHSFK
jgi:hypothetical protein